MTFEGVGLFDFPVRLLLGAAIALREIGRAVRLCLHNLWHDTIPVDQGII